MPELLEMMAEKYSSHAADLIGMVRDEMSILERSPDARRLSIEVSAARHLNHQVASFGAIVVEWRAFAEASLQKGMNGQDFQAMAGLGTELAQTGLNLAASAEQLWTRLERLDAPTGDVRDGRESLLQTIDAIAEVKSWSDHLAKLAGRRMTEIEAASIEAGANEIAKGHFKAPRQIIETLRSSKG